MKKNYSLFFFIFSMFFAFQVNAQSPRMVLIEEATQASCPPCASLNPVLQDFVNTNSDKVVFLGYQVWWPGFDPMYLDNEEEVRERVGDYYGFGFAPQITMQGSFVTGGQNAGSIGNLNQAKIDAIGDEESEFDMAISAEIRNGELKVSGSVDATKDVSGDLRLRIAVVEHIIHISDAPGGTNGETEYHNVFKKFLGGPAGIDLENSWAPGDTLDIEESFDLTTLNIYNYDEIQVIAFIQNDNDKYIHQATIAKDVPIVYDYANNVKALDVAGLPAKVCSGMQSLSPTISMINIASDELTSATIVYDVNGGPAEVYNWTGSVGSLETEEVTLPPISFDAVASNIINFQVTAPNGMADEFETDNQASSAEVVLSPTSEAFVIVEIQTDAFADETYWEVRDGAGEVVDWGGNPNVGTDNIGTNNFPAPSHADMYDDNTLYTDTVNILSLDCFTFHITDYFGDGLRLPYSGPPTFYRVMDNNGNIIIESANNNPSFVEEMSDYEGTGVNSAKELTAVTQLNFFPNPAANKVTASFDLTETLDNVMIEVSNIVGQQVMTQAVGTLTTGTQQFTLDISDLQSGLYLVTISNGDKIVSSKLQVQK